MSEGELRPLESVHTKEALARRQTLYDAVRQLFDTTNGLGLRVTYIPGDTARPHNSDRLCTALITVAEDDVIVMGGVYQQKVTDFFAEPTVVVHMRLLPADPHLSVCPNGITLTVASVGHNSERCGGTLMPDGSVDPRYANQDQVSIDMHTANVESVFQLFKEALDENRLKAPSEDF